MDFDGFRKMILSAVQDNSGKKEVIGTASPEILKRFKAWQKADKDLDHEREIEKLRLQKAYEDMFRDRVAVLEEEREAIWFAIENEMGVSHDSRLSINGVTGKVSLVLPNGPEDDDELLDESRAH